jgi:choice-of-anchor A domain-containing protein
MFRFMMVALIAAIAACGATGAKAAPLTAAEIMGQFNAVISDSFTSNSDIEGRLVTHTLAGGATFYNQPRGAASSYAAINAITVTSGVSNANVNNRGNVNVQGINQGRFNLNGGALVSTPAFTIGDFTAPLTALSAQLGGLAANSTINTKDPNSFTFMVTPNAQGLAVFSLDASQLSLARNLVFNGTADTIVINVTGTSFNSTANFNAGAFINQHVIWNFTNATTLGFMGWHGAVLAPLATVSNSSAMEGFLFARNFEGRGELHDFPFAGALPQFVPEPGTLALLASGMIGLCLSRRRRV